MKLVTEEELQELTAEMVGWTAGIHLSDIIELLKLKGLLDYHNTND